MDYLLFLSAMGQEVGACHNYFDIEVLPEIELFYTNEFKLTYLIKDGVII